MTQRLGRKWLFGGFPAAFLVALLLTACRPAAEPAAPAAERDGKAAADDKTVELLFTYGSEKEAWIKDVTEAFNKSGAKTAGGKAVTVKAVPTGSGECIDDLLSERAKPDLISPASGAFIAIGNAQSKEKGGKELVGKTKNLVLSPVVIAMWKPMAEALGWPDKPVGWSDIRELATAKDGWESKGKGQWGAFKFGHTHPDYSNSGLITLLAEMYAGSGKDELTPADVSDAKTAAFMHDVEKSVVHYGNSTGFFAKKMFANGPQYLSGAVLYESSVIESYGPDYKDKPFPVVAIYPKEGTFWSDHPVGIVQRDWVTDERKEAAQLYIDYLMKDEQQQKALKYGFRPGLEKVALGAPIDAEHGVNPKEPKKVLDVPSVEVMQAGRKAWLQNKKHARIVLVFDKSGSMNAGGKLSNAKKGATEIANLLGDEDSLGLLVFSDKSAWAEKNVKMKDGRDKVKQAISEIFAEGETALYDTIDQAYQQLAADPQPDVISAIIVLTDGEDNKSKLKLEELVKNIKVDSEKHTTRVFTIAYGEDASEKVLKEIAEATQAKTYKGTPENIRTVFKDIATFF
jgi:Ca-activated chloride channel family protein